MLKCKANGQNFDLALLALRATPLDTTLQSPAEILNGRKYRTTVPSMPSTVDAEKHVATRNHLQKRQQKSASYYNRSVREKPELVVGQCVRLLDLKRKVWEPATITGIADTPRSYIVQRLEGGVPLRRNRIHIKTTNERWTNDAPISRFDVVAKNGGDASTTHHVNPPVEQPGRSAECDDQQGLCGKRIRRQTVFYQAR